MKYDELTAYLNSIEEDSISLAFSEIESILSFSLPVSASKYTAWWANGGHTQADAWMNAGFITSVIDLAGRKVVFKKSEKPVSVAGSKFDKPAKTRVQQRMESTSFINPQIPTTITICEYPFRFIQEIRPDCDRYGHIILNNPLNGYTGDKPLNAYGQGPFCRFTINAEDVPGVYLWMLGDEIIYIGETAKFRQRFNSGYGNIQKANCFINGQTTNCKMNKVVLDLHRQGKYVKLYFHETADNKKVELDLLNRINTKYNVLDNLPVSDRTRFIVFDVETPNRYNNRISAIGISVVEGGRITDSFFSYVNPDTFFDYFNTQLTGIDEYTVRNAPSFPELWKEIVPLMSSGVLVAHNAVFDMGVLKKCLNDYGIRWREKADYCCTVQMGRRLLPGISHKLNDLCDYYGLCLDHHKADSDSRAAAEILIRYIKSGAYVKDFVKTYRL